MYNYLNYLSKLSVEEISIKNKSFLNTTKGKNDIEKAYDDLVLSNKKIDDVFYKNLKKELTDKNNTFQEAKKLFDLRVQIYKKLFLKEENLKFEKVLEKQ